MLIDRDDNIINLCEMKFTKDEYEITAAYDKEIIRKMSIFENKTKTRKAVTTVMITSYGLVTNAYSDDIQQQVTMDDMFKE